MTRPLRIESPGAYYHVLARGNAKQPIYLDDPDRLRFLDVFAAVVRRFGLKCFGYCLMDSHYHLFVRLAQANLSRAIQRLNGLYAQSFNRRHGRNGHLFGSRFKSLLVDRDPYFLELARYLALNPVRAGLVVTPEAWRWSHHRALAGFEKAPGFLAFDEVLSAFHSRDVASARESYLRFVNSAIGIDTNLARATEDGGILGRLSFRTQFAEHLGCKVEDPEFRRRERFANRPGLAVLFRGVRTKSDRDSRIRSARGQFGYTVGAIASQIGASRWTVTRVLSAGSSNAKDGSPNGAPRSKPSGPPDAG